MWKALFSTCSTPIFSSCSETKGGRWYADVRLAISLVNKNYELRGFAENVSYSTQSSSKLFTI